MTFDTAVQRFDSPRGVLGGEPVSDQLQKSSFVPLYALIVLVGAASGLLYLQKPLKSARPTAAEEVKSVKAMSTIDARLWQDPLLAVQHHINTHELKDFGETPKGFRLSAAKGNIELVIPVAIPGGFGVEDHETRLRSRYAVIAGLDFAGYSLSASGKLGVVKFVDQPVEDGETCVDRGDPQSWVPYEWAEPNVLRSRLPGQGDRSPGAATTLDKILVLWIPEDALSGTPIRKLACILTRLLPGTVTPVPIRFLGPTSSDGHREIISELTGESPPESPADFQVLSSWATAADILFQLNQGSPTDRTASVKTPDWYTRVIASDEVLVKNLLAELKSRRVDPTEDQIALISEWDTFYGRALPLSFAAHVNAWKERKDEPNPPDASNEDYKKILKDEPGNWPRNIVRVAYLQGLDGQIAGLKPLTTRVNQGESKKQGIAQTDIRNLERPEGRSQLDYARRLALDLVHRRGRGLGAIGIVGSDVYDKLLLIQALRELFPHAIFFTTDLDERMTHPSQTRWTRNLVIASSFGLRLTVDEGLPAGWVLRQRQTPPFRDCYQTSLYRATLIALGLLPKDSLPTQARVYEAGRTRVHRLVEGLPERENDPQLAFLVAVLFGALLIWLLRHLRLAGETRWGEGSLTVVSFFGIVIIGWQLIRVAYGLFDEADPLEPFALADGVSIWPTAILRVLAACLAVYFIIRHRRLVRENESDLEIAYCLGDGKTTPTKRRITRWQRLLWVLEQEWPAKTDPVEVKPLWEEFRRRGTRTARGTRVLLMTVLYLLFGGALMATGATPVSPLRGDVAFWADKAVLATSVILFVVLVFHVIDTVLLDERLIRRLSDARSEWPDSRCLGWAETDRTREFMQDLMDIRFIAQRTEVTGRFVLGPFIVVFVMIVSRLSIFDRWDWPPALIAIISINSAYAIFAALVLRRTAEGARRGALARLKTDRLRCRAANDKACVDFLNNIIKEIDELKKGAFAPISQQPALRAILVPLGGLGTAAVLELLLTTM